MRAPANGATPATKEVTPSQAAGPTRVVSPFSLTEAQRQVKVGAPSDPAEHEANRVADQVTGGSPGAKPAISRMELLQRKTADMGEKEAKRRRLQCSAQMQVE